MCKQTPMVSSGTISLLDGQNNVALSKKTKKLKTFSLIRMTLF